MSAVDIDVELRKLKAGISNERTAVILRLEKRTTELSTSLASILSELDMISSELDKLRRT